MPVIFDSDPSGSVLFKRMNGLLAKTSAEFTESAANCIDIGVLNNMPDAALKSTERQILTLLDSAAGDVSIRLRLYTLPEIPRTDAGRRYISNSYSGVESLCDTHLDGLIVTGTEPHTPDLKDEPYWDSLIKVIDWATHNTHSTILSCLSAHAALLHRDGIPRRPLSDKRFGVFEFSCVSDHPLTVGIPSTFPVPQSRWNDIPAEELAARGYRILTRAEDAGVDLFVSEKENLLVFFQGHPEYETNTLLLEYRRDLARYLRRERDSYPSIPVGYFDSETVKLLTELRERAIRDRREELIAAFPTEAVESRLKSTWRSTATRIYRNWLAYICSQKERYLQEQRVSRGNLTGPCTIGSR